MCEIPPYLFIFFHLGPTKDTIPITHAEGWHRVHRLSTHTFLTSINRERSSHCKLTVRGAITLDLKKLQFQKMINSCTPTCLMQNYTLEWSIQAICCQSQKKNMLWREICSWQLHLVRAGCNVNRIYSHQTLCTQLQWRITAINYIIIQQIRDFPSAFSFDLLFINRSLVYSVNYEFKEFRNVDL